MSSPPPAEPPPAEPPRLLDELKESRREIVKTVGPALLVTVLGFLIAFYFVEPPPPKQLVIATGSSAGNYYAAAKKYQQLFEENGVQLTIRETAGSVENYDLLLNDDSVQLAIVQGGTAPGDPEIQQLESLCTLYLEPIWVFHRREVFMMRLADLQGKRIAVGKRGSGTQVLAEMLLKVNGVQDGQQETVFIRENSEEGMQMLRSGDIDAAFFVLSAESPTVQDLLQDPQLRLLGFDRSRAYAQRYPYLEEVLLAQGVIDLKLDLPPSDVKLIAPAANLVATQQLHDAFIPMLLEAATDAAPVRGSVTEPGRQPSLDGVEFPPNAVARHYLKHGPSFFQEYLGFWLASLVDRTKIMLLPLIVLLIPLLKLAPPVYRWRIRSRIYRWYALLREIDQSLRKGGEDDLRTYGFKLVRIERELEEVAVPLSYMEEFYDLRLHIDLVKRRLGEQQADSDRPDRQG